MVFFDYCEPGTKVLGRKQVGLRLCREGVN